MRAVLASHNKKKMAEMRAILGDRIRGSLVLFAAGSQKRDQCQQGAEKR